MEANFDNFKVRCSKISVALANSRSNPVLTEKQEVKLKELRDKLQSKGELPAGQATELAELEVKEQNGSKIILSDGYIEYLMEEYAWITEGMIPVNKESLDLLAIRKGKECEEEGITLLTRVDNQFYKTHKERIYNEFLSGEIDAYLGEHIYAATNISDIKNAFDYPTFLKKIHTGLENGQEEQVQGYQDITGAREGDIVNTLCSASDEIITEKKWQVAKKMNAISIESPDFLAEWPKWEKSMRFDHIPIHKRVHKIKIEPFSEFTRQKLYDRVKIGREWLNQFHEKYQNMNLSNVNFIS